MASILDSLNEAQHTAVTSPSSVLQILAPPGSGKTKTLTSRVAYLLQHHHFKPWNVICLTFTIKSSREMKERLAKLLGNGIESRLILGTFHSICRRYLVTYGHLIGLKKDFGIADSSDTISIIKRIIKRHGLNVDPRKAQSRISSSKSRGVSHAELAKEEAMKKKVEQQEFAIVFQEYEDQLAKSNLLDYDDLLLRCVDLLRQHPACVSNVEVVLIDEFQDTNIVQFDLMRLFAAKNKRVTTVGDPDQSIYGWRSAEIKNLKRMQKQYPDTLVIHLKDNYRSSGAILLAAHEIIEQDESRPSKPLLPTHCPGTIPVLRRLPSAENEASWIVYEIQRAVAMTGNVLVPADFAILLRSASLSRHIESAMGKAGIPYRMVGGQRFFDRVEIKILLDYLRVISQPHNNDALSRIINVPARGIGVTTAKGLLEEAEMKRASLWTYIRETVQGHKTSNTKISKTAGNGLGSLIGIILTSRDKVLGSATTHSPEDILKYLIKKLDLQTYLEKTHANDHETRWANVEELLAQATEYAIPQARNNEEEDDCLPQIEGLDQLKGSPAEEALSKFLANVALATELQREDEDAEATPQSQVTISTIHAAKGLEWPVVFVPSAYEGCIPHSRAEDTDEERRLLYVAMTRAQALLYLSCPTKNSQREATTLSQFLSAKKVGRLLTNKAPTINSGTVNDICRILGRDVPTETQIFEASGSLKSRNDDLWPLNGEEDVKSMGARWSKWDNHGSGEHANKRRRTKSANTNDDSNGDNAIDSANGFVMSKYGASTTMQSSSSFSYNGFVSATAQLHHADEDKKLEALKKAPPMTTAEVNTKTTVSQGGQGSLMSFWNVRSKPDDIREDPTSVDLYSNKVRASHSCPINPTSFKPAVSSPQTFTEISSREHGPRIPLAPIPQSLSSHRLPSITTSTRPCSTTNDEPAKRQYVFLSSSPPQCDTIPEIEGVELEAEIDVEEHQQVKNTSSLPHSKSKLSDIKPASTLHTTSIDEVQMTLKAPRKTLGVRRSMNGWATRANQGFSVPKMAGSKPQRSLYVPN